MRRIVVEPWFALVELFLVMLSGVCWILFPAIGILFTLLATLPWMLRLLAGYVPFKRTPFDLLMLLFLVTAWVGYWAAYDKTSAWIKVWFVITAILLYYVLNAQPKLNFASLSFLSFCLGLGLAIYFFLTDDFAGSTSRFAAWWLNNRLETALPAMDPDYACGLLVITITFATYWLQKLREKPLTNPMIGVWSFVLLAFGVIVLAFLLTLSLGVLAAIACGLIGWFLWPLIRSKRLGLEASLRPLFPLLMLLFLASITVFVYIGPAQMGDVVANTNYGFNSRTAVVTRGLYFLLDYPFTGAGLSSFPGIYSQYMLIVPHSYFINSYNMFLDVAIEQGWLGGSVFALIYLGSVWHVCKSIVRAPTHDARRMSQISLFALIFTIVHGLLYDYLYNGVGTLLLFFPVGFAMMGISTSESFGEKNMTLPGTLWTSPVLNKAATLAAVVGIGLFSLLNWNKSASLWYSNLGAVQMAQVELKSFPTGEWTTAAILPDLEEADSSFRLALLYDPSNLTANYRLGLISMLRQDFGSAVINLENSYSELPRHRGVVKNLGYCYIWLGDVDKGAGMLADISEAESEMNVYSWWWDLQGRQDLAINASQFASALSSRSSQP